MLEQVLTPANLRLAWEAVAARKGAPGIDRVSVTRWARTWEERLMNLADSVRRGRYRPAPLRQIRIPKRNRNEWRTLRVPTITDRVLQRAAYQAISPMFERQFLACSFGYRPGLGTGDAVAQVLAAHRRQLNHVLDADITAFFDHVDHGLLRQLLSLSITDRQLLRLVSQWLGQGQVATAPPRGLPMGSPLSPLLANIYLQPVDRALSRPPWIPVRYADDIIVLAPTRSSAERARDCTSRELESLRLTLHRAKTRITSFDQGFDFLGVHFERNRYSFLCRNLVISGQADSPARWPTRWWPQYE